MHGKCIFAILHVFGVCSELSDRKLLTDEGKVPEMRIWSILLIKSDLKWCIRLSRSLFLNNIYVITELLLYHIWNMYNRSLILSPLFA